MGAHSSLWRILLVVGGALLAHPSDAAAQGSPRTAPSAPAAAGASAASAGLDGVQSQEISDNTVNIVAGSPNGTYLQFVYDMAVVLDDQELRILPIVGKGGGQNVIDILRLKGVDLGVTQTDILKHFRRSGAPGASIADRLVYVTKLYHEELHVVAGATIPSLKDLEGKIVSFGEKGSSADVSGRLIFEALGIRTTAINMNQADALLAVQSGKIAATLMLDGKPLSILAHMKDISGVRLLPVPFSEVLEDDYLPAELSSEDYPNLVPAGESIESVAVGTVLAAYNWPKNTVRYQRVARLVQSLFGRLAEFQKQPRHPKWKEVNLGALVVGWKRFPAAAEWLGAGVPRRQAAAAPIPTAAAAAVAPVAAPIVQAAPASVAPANKGEEQLFKEYLEWKAKKR